MDEDEDEDLELQQALSMSLNAAAANDGSGASASAQAAAAAGAAEAAATPAPMEEDGGLPPAADQGSAAEDMVPPAVDEALLAQAMELGFPELRARKALLAGSETADAVVEWCLAHGDDADIDDPIPLVPRSAASAPAAGGTGAAPKSWRCVETGRLFRTMEEVQMYAEKTGR